MKAEPMKATELKATPLKATEMTEAERNTPLWKTYRTRFLVQAKQLSCALAFTDSLGRRHSGRRGDYLVESSDGVLSIAPRQIFEDIYVSMPATTDDAQNNAPATPLDEPARVRRKLPQPCSDPRPGAIRGVRGQGSGASHPVRFFATGL